MQLVGQETPPVRLGPMRTGLFVHLFEIIALLSLRSSDLGKLAREDQPQSSKLTMAS